MPDWLIPTDGSAPGGSPQGGLAKRNPPFHAASRLRVGSFRPARTSRGVANGGVAAADYASLIRPTGCLPHLLHAPPDRRALVSYRGFTEVDSQSISFRHERLSEEAISSAKARRDLRAGLGRLLQHHRGRTAQKLCRRIV
jgi:hypothetical protein